MESQWRASANNIVATPYNGACSLLFDLTSDEISATGGRQRFARKQYKTIFLFCSGHDEILNSEKNLTNLGIKMKEKNKNGTVVLLTLLSCFR